MAEAQRRRFGRAELICYALAVVLVLAAFTITAAMKRHWNSPSFMLFVPAIAVAAWRCGRLPTILSAALSLFLIDWFFLAPAGSLKLGGSAGVLDMLAFLMITAAIIGTIEALRNANRLAEQRAAELGAVAARAAKLQEVTGALSEATTAEEVTTVVLTTGLSALEATRGLLVRGDGDRVELLGIRGYVPTAETVVRKMIDDGDTDRPAIAALRNSEAIWLRSPDEPRQRFPRLMEKLDPQGAVYGFAAVPLTYQNETVGAISLSFGAPAALGIVDEAFTRVLAQAAAAALHRAFRYDTERARRRDAELLAHAREEVLGIVAHDVRNPLNLIGTTTQLLQEDGLGSADRARMCAICLRAVKQMNRLIADLLDTVRLQSRRLSLNVEDVPVTDVVQQAEYTFRPLADAQHVAFNVECPREPGAVRADAGRVAQVLGNLIGNSLKFTPAHGAVTLRVQPERQRVVFQVADTGAGIAPGDLDKIFQDF